ncbi:MAG TPA: DUF711 family protein [Puia sp.]|nr:DUF711 family protein [Puia sp.]
MKKTLLLFVCFFSLTRSLYSQPTGFSFRVRTITAGVTPAGLADTGALLRAIHFLTEAKKEFTRKGYTVQTLRVSTANLCTYLGGHSLDEALDYLQRFDRIAAKNGVILSIGQVLAPNQYEAGIADWAERLVRRTQTISFSLPISSHALGIHAHSIHAAAEIILALSKVDNGEANFRFTASANCPAGIPFFPAAFHEGGNSFAIGLESANLLTEAFSRSDASNARSVLKALLEKNLQPVQETGERIATASGWVYDGIDVSAAPGLDASIGKAIETYTHQPFGSPSTLGACALITDVLKGLDVRKCGYSGLMLPVIEDPVLAKRAEEGRYTIEELLLFSSVSGTGLDVVPIAGDTPPAVIEAILTDVAALSLKYTAKALSARLFPLPGKKAGDRVEFANPHLTGTTVMKIN